MGKDVCREIVTDFIVENRDSAYRLAYSYVHEREDALDIVQDSVCKALSSVKSLDRPDAVKTWFYRIVINTAIDFIRRHKKHLFVEVDRLAAANDSYSDFDLSSAIASLSTANKTVIVLRFHENMKLDEIATVMNENLSTTKTRLYSSLKKLRVQLEEPC